MRHDGPVVIALDGSPHSERTLEWGVREASRRGAPALLVRAHQEPTDYSPWAWYPAAPAPPYDTEPVDYLARARASAASRDPEVDVTTRLLRGPTVPGLRALTEDARLLVLGAGRRRGVGRVALHLAAHARCPVVLVRETLDPGTVVVGVDGSAASLAAADRAATEASLRGVPLVVLHARPTVASPYGPDGVALPALADADTDDPTHRAARDVAARLRAAHDGLDVRLELVDDDPAHALVTRAGDDALLVVGSRGLGAFRGMLLGSVSADVLRTATSSVLVVHSGEAA